MTTQIPSVNVNFVDDTGRITPSWYRLLTDLSKTVNNNSGDLDNQQVFAFMADQDQIDPSDIVDNQPILWANDEGEQPRSLPTGFVSISLGTSPATYTASSSGSVLISGGTVSSINITRLGVTITTGLTSGFIPVEKNDQVTVTYSVIPTGVTFISRVS